METWKIATIIAEWKEIGKPDPVLYVSGEEVPTVTIGVTSTKFVTVSCNDLQNSAC